MLREMLDARALLPILAMEDGRAVTRELWPARREELLDILQKYLYGYTPPPPKSVTGTVVSENPLACAGKVLQREIRISFDTPGGELSFPLHLFLPKMQPKAPVFLHIAFRPDLPDRYTPIEEITDGGFALALFCYKDVVNDNHHGDYSDGLGALYINGPRRPDQWGKIGMWAYAASRVMDYLETLPEVNAARVAVGGHSRLGKTALWCAAQDTRFWAAISNNSGFGGAAVAKHGEGERVDDFLRAGSWDWFCETYKTFRGREDEQPYDQHFLLACVAPRAVYVGSAVMDRGADPKSEFLSALEASRVWELLGLPGLPCPDRLPVPGDSFHGGRVGYHLRDGLHYFSRYDWNRYMEFLRARMR